MPFSFSEIISIFLLSYLYTKFTVKIHKSNEIQNYENLDLIIIYLSIFQVYLMMFSLILSNNFGFTIFQEISKFTQNMIICGCVLLQIFLWQKYPIAIYIIKNYVLIFTLFNLFILVCGFLLEYSFLEQNFCFSIILKILPVLGFIFNLLLIAMAIYNNYEEQNESRKNANLIYENDNLGAIIDKYASSLQKMRKYYLIFIFYFTISYFVDVYFKFSNIRYDDNIINSSSNIKKQKNINYFNDNDMNNGNNFIENIKNMNISKRIDKTLFERYNINKDKTEPIFNSKISNPIRQLVENKDNLDRSLNSDKNRNSYMLRYISACEYYKDLGDKYSFKELLVCFISFIFRDIGPHIYIFISLFLYKPETLSRSSSFEHLKSIFNRRINYEMHYYIR